MNAIQYFQWGGGKKEAWNFFLDPKEKQQNIYIYPFPHTTFGVSDFNNTTKRITIELNQLILYAGTPRESTNAFALEFYCIGLNVSGEERKLLPESVAPLEYDRDFFTQYEIVNLNYATTFTLYIKEVDKFKREIEATGYVKEQRLKLKIPNQKERDFFLTFKN